MARHLWTIPFATIQADTIHKSHTIRDFSFSFNVSVGLTDMPQQRFVFTGFIPDVRGQTHKIDYKNNEDLSR